MKIEIRERPYKVVLYWMSREEAENKNLIDSLKPQFLAWKDKKYLPVIFESGDGNLEDSMYMLMRRNLELMVKKNDDIFKINI